MYRYDAWVGKKLVFHGFAIMGGDDGLKASAI